MIRSLLGRGLFVAIGAAAAGLFVMWRVRAESVPFENIPSHAYRRSPDGHSAPAAYQADIERRLQRLEAAVADAATERQRLSNQLNVIGAQLAARALGSDETAQARVTAMSSATAPAAPLAAPQGAAAEGPAHTAANAPTVDDGQTPMEHALAAAGLDAGTAADIKRRQDALVMKEIYLRDQATREQWQDSPRFAAEMAAIDAQRTPLRNEIGDDAYDRYLFALGQANRVRVDEVLTQSPAEQAGLQAGDLIVRYGEARLFTPGELVDQTRSGTAGEAVQLEIIRNGERLQVNVPRGPLGLRVAGAQGAPDAS
jgi:hypothetical protein